MSDGDVHETSNLRAELARAGADGRRHQVVGQQVLMLVDDVSAEELEALNTRAVSQRVGTILKAMRNLANELAAGRVPPASDELHNIARTALQAEYSPKKP